MNAIVKNDALVEELNKVQGKITEDQYRIVAKLFQDLAEQCVRDIWARHGNSIQLELNGVKVATKGSAVNTSTAIGFLVEEFIVKQLPSFFAAGGEATGNSAFDFAHTNQSSVKLMVNLKVEKNTSNNTGIVAGNILRDTYLADNKPKLYLILKSQYEIDEENSSLIFKGLESFFLEAFITVPGGLKSDNRSWSEEFKILSGRLQLPTKKILSDSGTATIPSPDTIRAFIAALADKLKVTKSK